MAPPRPAWHFDGLSAVRQQVTVALEADGLRLLPADAVVRFGDLQPVGDSRVTVFRHRRQEGWRLGFDAPLPAEWQAALPRQEHHGGLLDRIGVLPTLLGGVLAAAALLLLFGRGAALLAHLIPPRWEAAAGAALMPEIGGRVCTGAAGQRAIDALARRLGADGMTRVEVVDLDMVNALALPGRHVVLFRGLIARAGSPGELAGVLAHEIGHVERRHVSAALLRTFGVGVLVGGVDGGVIVQTLMLTGYGRAAEREADAEAIARLARAGISPGGIAAFFTRLGADEKKLERGTTLLRYIASHPLSEERRRAFAASVRAGARYRSALTAAEWRAVGSMCDARQ